MPDREKVMKAIEICIKNGCKDGIPNQLCPYSSEVGCDLNQILADALELLKEQEANTPSAGEIAEEMVNYICEHEKVVRCKDCQFYNEGRNEVDAWMRCRLHSMNTSPDEFCSWAVKKN